MNSGRIFLVAFIAMFAWVATSATATADPREKVETAVAEGVRLLEAKDYPTFLKNFVKPDDFKRLTEKMSLEEFATGFGEGKAEPILKVLKSLQDTKPELDATGTKATYAIKEALAGKREITFTKVDKYWYIEN